MREVSMTSFDSAVAAVHRRRLAAKVAEWLFRIAGLLVGFLFVGPWLLDRLG